MNWRRRLELIPLVPLALVALATTVAAVAHSFVTGHLHCVLGMAAWALAPLAMRPLTFPGVTRQQRYAVGSLIGGAIVVWVTYFGPMLERGHFTGNAFAMLCTIGLVAIAGYLRMGWQSPAGGPNESEPVGESALPAVKPQPPSKDRTPIGDRERRVAKGANPTIWDMWW